jgi:hypothetical protein
VPSISTEERTSPREQGGNEERIVYIRPPTQPQSIASIEAGNDALTQGAWEEARAHFETALEEEETPEALEGLSWSAWWLDDAETVFDAREHAYRLYRKRGDAAGAARMVIWLAVDHLDFHGALAVASVCYSVRTACWTRWSRSRNTGG